MTDDPPTSNRTEPCALTAGNPGATDPNAKPDITVPGPSGLLGAQSLIRGAVTEFNYHKSSRGINGLLGNILGGILAIPLTAALRVLMFRYVWKRPQASFPRARRGVQSVSE